MRLNFNMQMLERMGEGVVLLNRQAQVVAHNAASGAWIALCREKAAALKVLIEQATMGRVELPARLNLFAKSQADGVPAADAWLCKNGLQEYAVFLSPHPSPVTDEAVAEKRFVSLLGDEVRAHMQQLRLLLQDRASGAALSDEALNAQCVLVDSLLSEIADLSLLMQRASPFDDERIEMDLLLPEQLARLQPKFESPFVFKPGAAKQGVLYGNAPWLSTALRTLLTALGNSAPPGSEIVVTMHQMGGFLVLTGDVAGQYKRPPNPRPGSSAPEARKPAGGTGDSAPMLMAKRIIELHTGKLKLNFLQAATAQEARDQVIESFTLTLPTGVSGQQPVHTSCSECPIALQAHLYASDMAILLAGQ